MDHFSTGIDQRKFDRVPFKRNIKYKLQFGDVYFGHIAQDLSQGGLKIFSSQFIPVNSKVHVQVQLTDEDRVLELETTVAWIKHSPSLSGYQIGLEFLGEAIFQKMKIGRHIRSAAK